MNEPVQSQAAPDAAAPPAVIIDSPGVSNFVGALLVGAVAAAAGGVIWAAITVATKMQIGLVAIGIGLLVGFAVRAVGKSSRPAFGVIGAVFALLGCVLGNLLSACAFIAMQGGVSPTEMALKVLSSPQTATMVLEETFDAMDLLFYAIAAYEGFKFGRRPAA
jgi:hypothetical protein